MNRRALTFALALALIAVALCFVGWSRPAVQQPVQQPAQQSARQPAQQLDRSLARTPQLGWNDWNSFGCQVSDTLIRQTADALVSSGMAAAGYRYVNIDDCWSSKKRDGHGNLVPDPVRFPNGIKSLADYVHGKGLKLGIYSSAGLTTCAGYPASLTHEQQDADLWASWGIDYLKYDNCGATLGRSGPARYAAMRDALAKTGRPIFFAICNWGYDDVGSWGPATGDSWRTTRDIKPTWASVMTILDQQHRWTSRSGPGGWNDPDMLEVGNGLSENESRAHFSLWALLNAPLIAGNDLRSMSPATRAILTNTEVIGVDQDWGGAQGTRAGSAGGLDVWKKPMSGGGMAVALLNRRAVPALISTSAPALGLTGSSFTLRNLWAHTSSRSTGTISAAVPAHGVAMFIVKSGAR